MNAADSDKTTSQGLTDTDAKSKAQCTALSTALAHAARSLPEPRGYYQGHRAPSLVVPTNVLAFHRTLLLMGASCHSRYVLVINVNLPALLAVDGVVMDMPPASAALVCPYQHHHYPRPDSEQTTPAPCRLFFTFELPEAITLTPLRQRVIALDAFSIQCALRACEIYPHPDKAPADDIQNELVLLMAQLIQTMITQATKLPAATALSVASPASVNSESRQLVLAVGRYLSEHLAQPVTIPGLAEALAISPSHLRHLFKMELKVSLGQYIRRSKSIQAAALIDTTSRSFSQIAEACGFTTLSAFSRSFAREMGMSPRQYRGRHQQPMAQV